MPDTADSLPSRVADIYERHPHQHHILPYIGDALVTPTDDDLRVLTVGINSCVSEKDWPPKPEWHRDWIEDRTYPFQRGVLDEAAVLAQAVVQAPSFRGKRYEEPRCIYATNAVKIYVPETRGKRAANLNDRDLAAHEKQWRDELALLAEVGAMPHVVIVFSRVHWPYAWQAFHPKHGGPALAVTRFVPVTGDAPHRMNRITLKHEGREHALLLVRLRHPAGRGKVGTANWLCERAAFRQALRSAIEV